MKSSGEVTVHRGGKTYGATYQVEHGMVQVTTHTETRSVELGSEKPEAVARRVLDEIIDANRPKEAVRSASAAHRSSYVGEPPPGLPDRPPEGATQPLAGRIS